MKKTVLSLLFTVAAGILAIPGVSAAPKPTPAALPAPTPVDATGWTTPRPPYPESARREKLGGSVRVRVNTDRNGRVKRAKVVQSSGHKELDDATVAYALANWTGPAFSQAEYVQNYSYGRR